MGNCVSYYLNTTRDDDAGVRCEYCNGTTRIVVGTDTDGIPVAQDCPCFASVADENPRG